MRRIGKADRMVMGTLSFGTGAGSRKIYENARRREPAGVSDDKETGNGSGADRRGPDQGMTSFCPAWIPSPLRPLALLIAATVVPCFWLIR